MKQYQDSHIGFGIFKINITLWRACLFTHLWVKKITDFEILRYI